MSKLDEAIAKLDLAIDRAISTFCAYRAAELRDSLGVFETDFYTLQKDFDEAVNLIEQMTSGHFGGQPGYLSNLALIAAHAFLKKHEK